MGMVPETRPAARRTRYTRQRMRTRRSSGGPNPPRLEGRGAGREVVSRLGDRAREEDAERDGHDPQDDEQHVEARRGRLIVLVEGERDRRDEREEDLRLAERREHVVLAVDKRPQVDVHAEGDEADDEAEDELRRRARGVKEGGQAADGDLAQAVEDLKVPSGAGGRRAKVGEPSTARDALGTRSREEAHQTRMSTPLVSFMTSKVSSSCVRSHSAWRKGRARGKANGSKGERR